MRYSVSSRFRGTLLGAAIADCVRVPEVCPQDVVYPQQTISFAAANEQQQSHSSYDWGKMAVLGAESLVKFGCLDIDDWQECYQILLSASDATSSDCLQAIKATLPVALFFHENPVKLHRNLLRVVEIWQDDSLVRDGALAVGYAISQCLTEKLNPVTLIPQTIAFLGETSTGLPQQLEKVQMLLQQGSGWTRAMTELNREEVAATPVALAFYCFLSTLEDWRLSVLRSSQKSSPSQIVAAITGALSGAYNSTIGIPTLWRMMLARSNDKGFTTWGMITEAEMLILADRLFAAWSGVYQLIPNVTDGKEKPAIALWAQRYAIAAPRFMR